ncbi:MAG TPA: polysaccharide biosynthesis/export family protein [Gemmatimonadaceae bacterium]|nr:polysaccharide biosynthesis/export family protein [Gemmatimonadaceae bacterium]
MALAQNPQSTPVSRPPITLRAGDVLKVRVWPDSVLSGQFTVEDNGVVVLPELGDVLIAGKDIRDIQTMLRELYGRVRKSAIVHVSPIFRVGVLGQVQRPGLYAAEPTMTWFDIISLAGGFTDRAARDRVTVVRDGRELLINTVASDLALASSLSVEVRSGDKVIVPQRRGWNWITALGVAQFVAIMASLALQARR